MLRYPTEKRAGISTFPNSHKKELCFRKGEEKKCQHKWMLQVSNKMRLSNRPWEAICDYAACNASDFFLVLQNKSSRQKDAMLTWNESRFEIWDLKDLYRKKRNWPAPHMPSCTLRCWFLFKTNGYKSDIGNWLFSKCSSTTAPLCPSSMVIMTGSKGN